MLTLLLIHQFKTIQNSLTFTTPSFFVHTWQYHLSRVDDKLYYHLKPFRWFQLCIHCTWLWHSVYGIVYGNLVANDRLVTPTPPGITQSWHTRSGILNAPLKTILIGFCTSCTTIQNHVGNQLCAQLSYHSIPFTWMVSKGVSTCYKKAPIVGGL